MLRINNKLCAWIRSVGIVCALTVILTSCRGETSYYNRDYICNATYHEIKITYYNDGLAQSGSTINSLSKGTCNLMHESSGFGKGGGSNYLNSTINMDSAVVQFDKSVQAIHYGYNKVGVNPKAITYGSPRNIFGGSSTGGWVYRVVSTTKNFVENELKYTFVEKDYLNAKNE